MEVAFGGTNSTVESTRGQVGSSYYFTEFQNFNIPSFCLHSSPMPEKCFEAFEFLYRRPLSRGRVSRMCSKRKWTNCSRFSEFEPGSVQIHTLANRYIAIWICYPIQEAIHQTSGICNSTYVLVPPQNASQLEDRISELNWKFYKFTSKTDVAL